MGHTSLLLTILIWFTGFVAFQRLLLLEYGGGPEKDRDVCVVVGHYARSPRIRLASSMSFGMMVTRLAWMAHRLASSNSLTRYASAASWRHSIAADWNRRSVLKSWAISLTSLWKGSFRMSSAVVFWKWQMSCRAAVPALYLWGFTCLPCILASCIFLFCSSVQSRMRWPSIVLSLV